MWPLAFARQVRGPVLRLVVKPLAATRRCGRAATRGRGHPIRFYKIATGKKNPIFFTQWLRNLCWVVNETIPSLYSIVFSSSLLWSWIGSLMPPTLGASRKDCKICMMVTRQLGSTCCIFWYVCRDPYHRLGKTRKKPLIGLLVFDQYQSCKIS